MKTENKVLTSTLVPSIGGGAFMGGSVGGLLGAAIGAVGGGLMSIWLVREELSKKRTNQRERRRQHA